MHRGKGWFLFLRPVVLGKETVKNSLTKLLKIKATAL